MNKENKYLNLVSLGLSENQITVYTTLLRYGLMLGRNIILKTGIKKGLVYKVLEQLETMELVEKKERGNQAALFFPAHPNNLQKFLDEKREIVETSQNILDESLGSMVSQYNLLAGKPNVQFFEGINGTKKVAFDSLTSQTPIYAYIDSEAVDTNFSDLNAKYVQKRIGKKTPKKILFPDTAHAKKDGKNITNDYTSVRIMNNWQSFATIMYIYDNKVSYITLEPGRLIGVIIEDKSIYKMHKSLFEQHWEYATSITSEK